MTSRFRVRARATTETAPGDWPAGAAKGISKTNTKGYYDAAGKFWSSKAEYNFAQHLLLLEAAGLVRNIRYQVQIRYDLHASLPAESGGNSDLVFVGHRSLRADFVVCLYTGRVWQDRVVDVKGWSTPEYQEKAKVLAALGIVVLEVPANDWTDAKVARRARTHTAPPIYW